MNTEQNISPEDVRSILSAKGVSPSHQRLSILKYIINNHNHPSVDKIYKSLSPELPTLSRMTVYNTLKLLTEKGIVEALSISESEVLYDYKSHPHAHFQCKECTEIYDIDITADMFTSSKMNGHQITDTQIHLKGICKVCNS